MWGCKCKHSKRVQFNHLPSSDDPDGDGLLQLPGRSIDDITAYFDPLSAHPWLVKDVHLEKMWTNIHTLMGIGIILLISAREMFVKKGVGSD